MENIIYALAFLLKLNPNVSEAKLINLAPAIAEMATTKQDVAILASTAYYETGQTFDCKLIGAIGEVSCFQIWTNNPEEKAKIKGSTRYAAMRSLSMIKDSIRMCRHLHPANRLSAYTTGRCMSEYSARTRYIKHLELLNSKIEITDEIINLKNKIYPIKQIKELPQPNSIKPIIVDNIHYIAKGIDPYSEYVKESNCPICGNMHENHYCPNCKN